VVEALEALRLLSSGTQSLPSLPLALDVSTSPTPGVPAALPVGSDLAWDTVLTQTDLSTLLSAPIGGERTAPVVASPTPSAQSSPSDIAAGLTQLNRYLSRTWYRAGIPPQMHDDSSQAVYVTLLQNLGRTRFDQLLADIGQTGIREVLSRETPEGPDFFRAIDAVKKRAQREKTFQPLDSIDTASVSTGEDARALWRSALQDAIDQSLTPREASLVYDTLMGKTPTEIAQQWGVAPKTVSNEKTRVIQKLRDALVADLSD
jgi:DNA-binding CsgD family transcriptional regulator